MVYPLLIQPNLKRRFIGSHNFELMWVLHFYFPLFLPCLLCKAFLFSTRRPLHFVLYGQIILCIAQSSFFLYTVLTGCCSSPVQGKENFYEQNPSVRTGTRWPPCHRLRHFTQWRFRNEHFWILGSIQGSPQRWPLCWAVQAVRMLCGRNQAVRLHRRW